MGILITNDHLRHISLDCLLGDEDWWLHGRSQPKATYQGDGYWHSSAIGRIRLRGNVPSRDDRPLSLAGSPTTACGDCLYRRPPLDEIETPFPWSEELEQARHLGDAIPAP